MLINKKIALVTLWEFLASDDAKANGYEFNKNCNKKMLGNLHLKEMQEGHDCSYKNRLPDFVLQSREEQEHVLFLKYPPEGMKSSTKSNNFILW